MKYFIALILFLHGLIHVLGFIKAFSWAEINTLSIPINKTSGIFWLISVVLFTAFVVGFLSDYTYTWLIGFAAVLISQILIITCWSDAKFGSLPNLLVLLLSISSYGHYSFERLISHDTSSIMRHVNNNSDKVLTEADIQHLPVAVKNWLMHCGALGKPCIRAGKVIQTAQLKMKPEQKKWYQARAVQYSVMETPAFIWSVNVKMNPLIQFVGRDIFSEGKGEMLIKLNSLFSIVDKKGDGLNEGSLQRFLGELVWFPSLATSKYIQWEHINDTTALASMEYNGTTGSGTFYFNSEGDFIRFSTLRFMGNADNGIRREWILNVEQYKEFEGIKVPSKMTATWALDSGMWTWLMLEIDDIQYNARALHSSDKYQRLP